MKLQNQDVVSVAEGGSVILKLDDDQYVYLEPNTRIQISSAGKTGSAQTKIELLSGAMSALIEKKLAQNESFSVTVDNVSMMVRGTIFRIARGQTKSGEPTVTVQTVEGTVGVTAGNGEQALGAGLQDVILLTDAGGTFTATDTPIDYSLLPPETQEWIYGALQDKLNAATNQDEIELLQEILASIGASSAGAAETSLPEITSVPPTPSQIPTPTAEPEYALRFRESSYGTVKVAEGLYPAGAKIAITVEARDGYEFNGWMINGESAPSLGMSGDITFIMPDSDTLLGARFKKTKYELSIEQPALGGTIQGEDGRYAQGSKIALTAEADTGYQLSCWLVNGSESALLGTSLVIQYTMPAANCKISAKFTLAPVSHSLSFEQPVQGGGSISLTAGQYASGDIVTISAAPDANMELAGLVINGVLDGSYEGQTSMEFTMPDEDVLISAVFQNIV